LKDFEAVAVIDRPNETAAMNRLLEISKRLDIETIIAVIFRNESEKWLG